MAAAFLGGLCAIRDILIGSLKSLLLENKVFYKTPQGLCLLSFRYLTEDYISSNNSIN